MKWLVLSTFWHCLAFVWREDSNLSFWLIWYPIVTWKQVEFKILRNTVSSKYALQYSFQFRNISLNFIFWPNCDDIDWSHLLNNYGNKKLQFILEFSLFPKGWKINWQLFSFLYFRLLHWPQLKWHHFWRSQLSWKLQVSF